MSDEAELLFVQDPFWTTRKGEVMGKIALAALAINPGAPDRILNWGNWPLANRPTVHRHALFRARLSIPNSSRPKPGPSLRNRH